MNRRNQEEEKTISYVFLKALELYRENELNFLGSWVNKIEWNFC